MSGVSQSVLNKAALHFLRNPGIWYSREDIQTALDISKPTACRLMNDLTFRISITEKKEGRITYYRLNEEDAKAFSASVDMFIKMTDTERLVMSILLSSGKGNSVLEPESSTIAEKFNDAGVLTVKNGIVPIYSLKGLPQQVKAENREMLAMLYKAVELCNPVTITYKGPWSTEEKTYTIWPLGFYLRDDSLYLYSWHPKYNNPISNAFSRIADIEIHEGERFKAPDGVNLESALDDPFGIVIDPPTEVEVEVYGTQAIYEKEKSWPEGTEIKEISDGIRMKIRVRDGYAFKHWLLGLGSRAKITSPLSLVQWISNEVKALGEVYLNQYCSFNHQHTD